MLWRQGYETAVEVLETAPNLTGKSLLGDVFCWRTGVAVSVAVDAEGLRHLEVWRRLIGARPYDRGLIAGSGIDLKEIFPPSQHAQLWEWDACPVPTSASSVTMVLLGDGRVLVMHGLPTEDAWERFEAELVSPS